MYGYQLNMHHHHPDWWGLLRPHEEGHIQRDTGRYVVWGDRKTTIVTYDFCIVGIRCTSGHDGRGRGNL